MVAWTLAASFSTFTKEGQSFERSQLSKEVRRQKLRECELQDFSFVALAVIEHGNDLRLQHALLLEQLLESRGASTHAKVVRLGCNVCTA